MTSKLYYTEITIQVISANPAQIQSLDDLEFRVQGESDVRRIDINRPQELTDEKHKAMICDQLMIKPTHFNEQGNTND